MRSDSTNFRAKNSDLSKNARYVIQIAFDTANTDLVYFKSHDDAALPSGAVENAAVVVSAPSTSQTLKPLKANSTIGRITATIQDTGSALTTLINTKLDGGDGLRHKRIRVYLGYKGLEWGDYALFQTQIIDKIAYKDGDYKFSCKDIQRSEKANIFDPKKTTLDDTITELVTTITVDDTTDFETVFHGTSYSDSPSTTVGYIRIDDEIIRYTGKTSTTFTGCTRGALNTNPSEHVTDSTISADRRLKVEEFIYLELPVVKLIYAILTGTIYGDSATLPDHWNLGISTNFVSTAKFITIGADIWDTTDDTKGRVGLFLDLKKISAKKFIETKLLRMVGCFTPILNDGQLGIKRLANVINDSSYSRVLNASNIINYSDLTHDFTQVHNNFVINWNYSFQKEETTRSNIIVDSASQTKHGAADLITLDMEGLDGGRHTNSELNRMFDFLRDRFVGPPELLTLECLFTVNDLEVGDIVRVQLDQIRDAAAGTNDIDRTFEIQNKKINTDKGTVSLQLFGSSEKATPITPTSGATSLASDVYSTTSLPSANKIDADPGGITTTLTGGVLHIDGNGTFTGQAALPGASNVGVYWYDGDVEIDSGVTVTITENVIIMVKGFLQVNGKIDGKGGGIVASTNGTAGYLGNTLAGGGALTIRVSHTEFYRLIHSSSEPALVNGLNDNFPVVELDYNGGTSLSDLTGIPTDMRGTSGGTGLAITNADSAAGGAGGAGGSGLVIIHRGIDVGAAGSIDLSGDAGTVGSSVTSGGGRVTHNGGAGGGGAAGGLLVLNDGADATETDVLTYFTANNGESPLAGTPLNTPGRTRVTRDNFPNYVGYFTGFPEISVKSANLRILFIPASETAVSDVSGTTSKASVSVVEVTNTPPTPGENLASIEVTATAPGDSDYSHSNVYWKLSTEPDTAYRFTAVAITEAVLTVPMDGATYDIKTVPVSIYNEESTDFDIDSITMSNQAGFVNLATGNYVASGQTAYDTGTGFYMGNDSGTPKFSIGNSAANKMTWNGTVLAITGSLTATTGTIGGWSIGATALTSGSGGTTVGLDSGGSNPSIYAGSATPGSAPFRVTNAGALTATNATITGAVTATSGVIAGWTINASEIADSAGKIHIDHANARIRMEGTDANDYVEMSASGIKAVDSVLGTTFDFKTDGSVPTISSGIINTTVFNVTSAGIIRTSATVGDGSASSEGVLINNNGLRMYGANTSNPSVSIDTASGFQLGLNLTAANIRMNNITGSGLFSIKSSTFGADGIQLLYNSGTPKMYVGDGTTGFKYEAGNITLASASNAITLDANAGQMSIKSTTFGNDGIQLDYNSGNPRLYVGDGADKSFSFDGTDVVLGRDSKFAGADSYNNDAIYVSKIPGETAYASNTSGGGTVSVTDSTIQLKTTTTGWADYNYNYVSTSYDFSWTNNRRSRINVLSPTTAANVECWIGLGNTWTGSNDGLSFKFHSDGELYAVTGNGTSTTTSTSILTVGSLTYYELEIIFDVGVDAKFYVNGVLEKTITTTLPAGSSGGDESVASSYILHVASGGDSFYITYIKFQQD